MHVEHELLQKYSYGTVASTGENTTMPFSRHAAKASGSVATKAAKASAVPGSRSAK